MPWCVPGRAFVLGTALNMLHPVTLTPSELCDRALPRPLVTRGWGLSASHLASIFYSLYSRMPTCSAITFALCKFGINLVVSSTVKLMPSPMMCGGGGGFFWWKKLSVQNLCSGTFGGNIYPDTKQRARHGSPFLEPPPTLLQWVSMPPPPPPAEQRSSRPNATNVVQLNLKPHSLIDAATRGHSEARRDTAIAGGRKCGNTGSPCLDKPVLPRSTWHGTHVAGISQPDPSKHDKTKQQASTHPKTQERMELQRHQHFATPVDPSCGLHKATNHIVYWIGTAKTLVPKKTQKCGNTGSPC